MWYEVLMCITIFIKVFYILLEKLSVIPMIKQDYLQTNSYTVCKSEKFQMKTLKF
jgi:hypothetical protein